MSSVVPGNVIDFRFSGEDAKDKEKDAHLQFYESPYMSI